MTNTLAYCGTELIEVGKVMQYSGTVFTTLHFHRNLQTGPISWGICYWQAVTA